MIGLDTNVLIRYIVQDDPRQAKKATRFIETRCTRDSPGFINRVVLCEIVWVLESAYRFQPDQISSVIEKMLTTAEFIIENLAEAVLALQVYKKQGIDFTDALIGFINRNEGCSQTITFDQKASRLDIFNLLVDESPL
ncbi:type II toxin-antitoxin system VapC family toxin [bacterium]|nr:type II toxin-antitoxin system VapC family toxin [bacterium]NUP94475.1 type II toxin-antitoxin system VapC family toxin [Candidatus Omnitrophota bacterium]